MASSILKVEVKHNNKTKYKHGHFEVGYFIYNIYINCNIVLFCTIYDDAINISTFYFRVNLRWTKTILW